MATVVALTGLFAGCDAMNNRKLRNLPADFAYEVDMNQHLVEYTDSEDREITLFGKLYEPQAKGKFPAIILSHGFNGHYSDFPTECMRFAERGYVCYAFDFCGAQSGGLSEGRTSKEYTPFTMKEDLCAAIANIKQLSNVDETQIFLFGGSQGGFVTALTAADEDVKRQIAAIAMYFPAFNIPDDWRNAPIQNTPLMGYSIGADYIRSIRDFDTYETIGHYKGDVCIIWGDQDALVKKQYIDRAVKTYGEDRVSLTILPGAGHGFGGAALTRAVKKVLTFFESHTYE